MNIPWAQAVKEDSTFKSADDLRSLYASKGVDLGKEAVAYCRIGERSSHTWSVLTYLLGLAQGASLRRLVDRMGQLGRGADRAPLRAALEGSPCGALNAAPSDLVMETTGIPASKHTC
jgi:hypothetical protein